MRRRLCHRLGLAFLPLFLLIPLPAQAQPVRRGKADLVRKYQQVTRHDFEEHTVTGGRANPDGTVVTGRGSAVRSSLIRVRTSFVAEMIRSAEEL